MLSLHASHRTLFAGDPPSDSKRDYDENFGARFFDIDQKRGNNDGQSNLGCLRHDCYHIID